MGIRCYCPNGHRLNLKTRLAGERGICPECGVRFMIPTESESKRKSPLPAAPSGPPPFQPEPTREPPQEEIEEPLDIGRAPLQGETIEVTPEPTLLPPRANHSQQTIQGAPLPPHSLHPTQDTYQSNQNSLQPDEGYGLTADSKNFDVLEGFDEVQPSASIPKIITTDRRPLTTIRTRTKKQARTAATLLLGMAALFLILVLFLVLYLTS